MKPVAITTTFKNLVIKPMLIKWLYKQLLCFSGKKGGALASAIYSYMQHGDPFVKSLIKHILTMVWYIVTLVIFVPLLYDGGGGHLDLPLPVHLKIFYFVTKVEKWGHPCSVHI